MSLMVGFFLLFCSIITSQSTCGYPPDLECLVKSSQYTILGNVVGNNLNDLDAPSSPSNYNATITIQCVWASYSLETSSGEGVQGKTVTVMGFGNGKSKCPSGSSAVANAGNTKIFFVNVATMHPVPNAPIVYSIVDICNGGVDYNPQNLQLLSDLMAMEPSHAISAFARGPSSVCSLPKSTASPITDSSVPDIPGAPTGNTGYTAFASMGLCMMIGILLILIT